MPRTACVVGTEKAGWSRPGRAWSGVGRSDLRRPNSMSSPTRVVGRLFPSGDAARSVVRHGGRQSIEHAAVRGGEPLDRDLEAVGRQGVGDTQEPLERRINPEARTCGGCSPCCSAATARRLLTDSSSSTHSDKSPSGWAITKTGQALVQQDHEGVAAVRDRSATGFENGGGVTQRDGRVTTSWSRTEDPEIDRRADRGKPIDHVGGRAYPAHA